MCTAFAILWDTKCNLLKGLISWFGTFPDNYWLANFFLISFNFNYFLISTRRYTFHLCFNDNWFFFTLHGSLHLSATSYHQILWVLIPFRWTFKRVIMIMLCIPLSNERSTDLLLQWSLLFEIVNLNWKIHWILSLVEPTAEEPSRPCKSSPCGTNALCNEQNNAFSCVCPTNYVGDPYSSCRPECVLNTDCSREKSCLRNQCVDPCPGTCGINSECRVSNHIPVCSCIESHSGDPYASCRPIPVISKTWKLINQVQSIMEKRYWLTNC